MKPTLLIVDDDKSVLMALAEYFSQDYEVISAASGGDGLKAFDLNSPTAVILDLRMPDMDGVEVLKKMKEKDPQAPVVMLTAFGDIKTAVDAIKLGAEQFLSKPVDLQALDSILGRAVKDARLKRRYKLLDEKSGYRKDDLVLPPEIWKAITIMAGNPDTTVLITGPTGVGKGVVAETIHNESARRDAPFVDINCAALTETLLESELFGHEAGAFTDAKKAKKGLMEMADGGTLFLDEIGEMPMSLQVRILKSIEDKTFRRVGGTNNINVDVRITAATNADLRKKVEGGKFREDLYYRLNVIPIEIPPLKKRTNEIEDLTNVFIKEFSAKMNKPIRGIEEQAMAVLKAHPWPGNIRELRNVIERAAILCFEDKISMEHLPRDLRESEDEIEKEPGSPMTSLLEMEIKQIIRTLKHTGNNRAKAAKILGIDVSTLGRKIKKYKIEAD